MAHGVDLERADAQHRYLRLALHPVTQRGPHACQELADIERLVDVVVGAEIERLDLFRFPLARRQNDDRHIGPFARPPDDVLSVAIRQSEIEQNDVWRFGSDALHAFSDCAGACHFVVVGFERGLEKAQDCRLIVNDQYVKLGAHVAWLSRGNVMIKRAPRPPSTGLSAVMLPPCASMMPLAIARPSPVP